MAAVKSPPLEGHAAIIGTFVGGLGVAGLLARALRRDPAVPDGRRGRAAAARASSQVFAPRFGRLLTLVARRGGDQRLTAGRIRRRDEDGERRRLAGRLR